MSLTANKVPVVKTGGSSPQIENGDLTNVVGTSITSGVPLILPAGTTSTAPLNIPAGTNLTSTAAGNFENDGNNLYFTPVGTSRGCVPSKNFMALTATNTMASDAAQAIFNLGGSSGGGVTVQTGVTYLFELQAYISSMSSSSGTLSLTFATTGTIGSIGYTAITQKSAAANSSTTTVNLTFVNQASATAIMAATTTTTGNLWCRGIIRMTTGGTLTPQISQSTAGTPVVAANSYFLIHPIGSNTVTTIGNIV